MELPYIQSLLYQLIKYLYFVQYLDSPSVRANSDVLTFIAAISKYKSVQIRSANLYSNMFDNIEHDKAYQRDCNIICFHSGHG